MEHIERGREQQRGLGTKDVGPGRAAADSWSGRSRWRKQRGWFRKESMAFHGELPNFFNLPRISLPATLLIKVFLHGKTLRIVHTPYLSGPSEQSQAVSLP